jgi:hypothetical protein
VGFLGILSRRLLEGIVMIISNREIGYIALIMLLMLLGE